MRASAGSASASSSRCPIELTAPPPAAIPRGPEHAQRSPLGVKPQWDSAGPPRQRAVAWLRSASRSASSLPLCLFQKRRDALRAVRSRLGQLIAARLPVELILFCVDPLCFGEDRPRQAFVVDVVVMGGVRVHLGAVHRNHADLQEPRLRAERKNAGEQTGQTRPRDALGTPRSSSGRANDWPRSPGKRRPRGAGALDGARGTIAVGIGVEQERHHHRGLVGGPAVAV